MTSMATPITQRRLLNAYDAYTAAVAEEAEDRTCSRILCVEEYSVARRKTSGVVRNLTSGAVSTAPDEDVQICVSVPVGDVDIAL